MKKLLMILGGIFVVLIVIGVVGFSVLAVKGTALDKESKDYVDEVTPIILAHLNKETLFQYAGDELINSASPEEYDKIFNWFSKLGKFEEYKGSIGEANIFVSPNTGKQISGKYVAKAEFESGPATINITAIKKGDKWQLFGFHINSIALANE
ncbi:hypothetical protein DSLASN_18420 [Desulfoluna limicola]|uniref:DUF4440 domain-containing protein n=1 Tax=Desulfoluna limicola TaxID=2810562 RepID=A0ABN6F3J4_9BACT|nr:hypothetical protein [Desulfoluna limicola]BCS96210.1 hypothetical protein DSLASN_18420 [Desulfoluna limicola]